MLGVAVGLRVAVGVGVSVEIGVELAVGSGVWDAVGLGTSVGTGVDKAEQASETRISTAMNGRMRPVVPFCIFLLLVQFTKQACDKLFSDVSERYPVITLRL